MIYFPYVILYYSIALLALSFVTIFYSQKHAGTYDELQRFMAVFIMVVYIVGMLRFDGVDIPNYRYAFEHNYRHIPDLGFQAIIRVFNLLELPYSFLMLLVGIVSLVSLKRVSIFFEIPFALVLLVWFLHIVVVRDFSQLRIGFAVSLSFCGLTSMKGWKKVLFYFFSASIHYSVVVFIVGYEGCRFIARVKRPYYRITLLLMAMVITFIGGLSILKLSFFFERIALYAAWDKKGYGCPIENYHALVLNLFILSVALVSYRQWRHDVKMRTAFYLQVLGTILFVSLSDIAIFAYRLSSVLSSLYPVLFIRATSALRIKIGARSVSSLVSLFLLLFLCVVLLSRSGSYDIVRRMTF